MAYTSSFTDPRRTNIGASNYIRTILLLLLLSIVSPAWALDIAYCSTENTGSSFATVRNKYQSNGACHDACVSSYSFAILQAFECWCSNFAPTNTVSVDLCNDPCPGYPNDTCGALGSGLFGYIALNIAPSAVKAPVVSTSSTSNEPSLTTPSITSMAMTPYASIVTITGEVHTIVITPTVIPPTETINRPQPAVSGGFWSNTGAIAGTFIAVATIVILVIASMVWFFRRNRSKQESKKWGPQEAPITNTTMSRWSKSLYTNNRNSLTLLNTESLTRPPADRSPEASTPGTLSRPLSTFIHDQRLDPRTLFNPALANGSRTSVNTFHDNQDYSRRVLHVVNPDN